jgi:hypothetical protein
MPPTVTYSLLALCAVVLVASIWLGGKTAQQRWPRLSKASLAITIGAMAAAYLVLRPGAGDDFDEQAREAAALQQPLFVDVYSNY